MGGKGPIDKERKYMQFNFFFFFDKKIFIIFHYDFPRRVVWICSFY